MGGIDVKKVSMLLLFLLILATSAFAANETIEELIAELEGKDSETTAQEQPQERGGEKRSEELEKESLDSGLSLTGHVTIKKDTEVLLKLVTPLKSGEVKVGQVVEFLVQKPVVHKSGITLIEENTVAYGEVTAAKVAGSFGQPGKLDFSVDKVAGYTGINIPLRAKFEQAGKGNEGSAFAGFLLMGVIGGLVKGSNVSVPEGTLFTAYVDKTTILLEDMELMQSMPLIEVRSEADQQLNDLFKQLMEKEELD